MTIGPVISYPVPAYQNAPIEAQYYLPNKFFISNIVLGSTTLVTTTTAHNYVVGQLVRLIIPFGSGCRQLNEQKGYVISISEQNAIDVPYTSIGQVQAGGVLIANVFTILGIPSGAQIIPGSFSAYIQSMSFLYTETNPPSGNLLLNGNPSTSFINYQTGSLFLSGPGPQLVLAFASFQYEVALTVNQIEINIDSSKNVDAFTTSTNPTQPQILAIGDINTGAINASGRNNQSTFIPGSFIDISPL